MTVNVQFRFRSGLPLMAFDNVRLRGSWDEQGRPSNGWTSHPMQRSRDEDGYDVFVARVPFTMARSARIFAGESNWIGRAFQTYGRTGLRGATVPTASAFRSGRRSGR